MMSSTNKSHPVVNVIPDVESWTSLRKSFTSGDVVLIVVANRRLLHPSWF